MAVEEEAAGVVSDIESNRLADLIDRLKAQGVRPLPSDHDLAVSLNLKPFYTRVYRPGSDTAHYSIGAALDGFLELTDSNLIGRVSLEMPSSTEADEVLIKAALTYGVFLYRCDPVIGHGLGKRVQDLLAALIEQLPKELRASRK